MTLIIFIFRDYVLWTPTLLTFHKAAPVWKRLARICLSRNGSNIYVFRPRVYIYLKTRPYQTVEKWYRLQINTIDLHTGILRRSNVTIILSIGRQRKTQQTCTGEKRKRGPQGRLYSSLDSFGLDSLESNEKAQGHTLCSHSLIRQASPSAVPIQNPKRNFAKREGSGPTRP